jgi:hypothetical protein
VGAAVGAAVGATVDSKWLVKSHVLCAVQS